MAETPEHKPAETEKGFGTGLRAQLQRRQEEAEPAEAQGTPNVELRFELTARPSADAEPVAVECRPERAQAGARGGAAARGGAPAPAGEADRGFRRRRQLPPGARPPRGHARRARGKAVRVREGPRGARAQGARRARGDRARARASRRAPGRGRRRAAARARAAGAGGGAAARAEGSRPRPREGEDRALEAVRRPGRS